MTLDEILTQRIEHQSLRNHHRTRRALLTDEQRDERDQLFRELFMANAVAPSASVLAQMEALVEAGASTDAFDDYELCAGGNVATIVEDWIVPFGGRHWRYEDDDAFLQGLFLAMKAGDAHVTNRAYIGNGGVPIIHWLFEWFLLHPNAFDESHPRWQAAERLLYALCVSAPVESRFWSDLFDSLYLPFLSWRRPSSALHGTQRRMILSAVDLLIQAPLMEVVLRDVEQLQHRLGGRLRRALFHPALHWLMPELIERYDRGEGIFGAPMAVAWPNGIFEEVIDSFLQDPVSRRRLMHLLDLSPQLLEAFFSQPERIFRLVAQRERKLLAFLLRSAPSLMLALRDEKGQSLLLYACTCRGRTERIIEMFVEHGFDLRATNDDGDDAMALAERLGDRKVLGMIAELLA